MKTISKFAMCLAVLAMSACAPLAAMMAAGTAVTAPPPQAPAAVTNISRSALDFALNSFDAALYGLDFAMDAGKLKPGSERAKKIAAVGRKVMGFLGAAEAARDLGNSATYDQAFKHATEALGEFRSLLGGGSAAAVLPIGMTPNGRTAVLERAAA